MSFETPAVNLLNPTSFDFKILKLPEVSYTIQSINIPGLTLPQVDQGNPFKVIPRQGDHITLDSLDITFLVDENLANWRSIRDWMRGIGFPEDFSQHSDLEAQPAGFGLVSDATLVINTNARVPNYIVTFKNISPTNLSSIYLDTRLGDDPASVSASFSLEDYNIAAY